MEEKEIKHKYIRDKLSPTLFEFYYHVMYEQPDDVMKFFKEFITKNIISETGREMIIKKGKGAFYSSGSRPNQTPFSWGLARLASVILGGPSRKVDKDIWEKYRIKKKN